MANFKRKLPVWAVILYAVTAVILLSGIALVIFSVINSAVLLPYKRQAIFDYFADDSNYYTVSGTVEERETGAFSEGAYPVTLTLDGVVSDEESINERGKVTFTVPAETYVALSESGFFDALVPGASAELYMAWNVWGKIEIAAFIRASADGVSYSGGAMQEELLRWIRTDLG